MSRGDPRFPMITAASCTFAARRRLPLAIPFTVDPPTGERAAAGAAMTRPPRDTDETLAAPAVVCSACLGRWWAGWPPIL